MIKPEIIKIIIIIISGNFFFRFILLIATLLFQKNQQSSTIEITECQGAVLNIQEVLQADSVNSSVGFIISN